MAKTLAEIEAIDKSMLLATDVAEYLGCDDGLIRWQAQNEPEKLGFSVVVMGSRVKIPKDAFLFYCRYGRPVIVGENGT
jgi:hypothetical protein